MDYKFAAMFIQPKITENRKNSKKESSNTRSHLYTCHVFTNWRIHAQIWEEHHWNAQRSTVCGGTRCAHQIPRRFLRYNHFHGTRSRPGRDDTDGAGFGALERPKHADDDECTATSRRGGDQGGVPGEQAKDVATALVTTAARGGNSCVPNGGARASRRRLADGHLLRRRAWPACELNRWRTS